jgi:hypothetical protein
LLFKENFSPCSIKCHFVSKQMEMSIKLRASVAFTNPDVTATATTWRGGWLDLRTSLDTVEDGKLTTSAGN